MDTLSKEITRSFYVNDEGYQTLARRWSKLVNSDERESLTAAHFLLYQVLRGRDWRKAFSPVTNAVKLANGGCDNWGLVHALRAVRSDRSQAELLAPFEGLLVPTALAVIRDLLPKHATLETAYGVKEAARAA